MFNYWYLICKGRKEERRKRNGGGGGEGREKRDREH